jgi:hypothetical protein
MNSSYCGVLFLVLFFLAASHPLQSQEDFALEEEISIPLESLEALAELEEHPLDINSATHDELLSIPYLSPVVCLRIIHYRKTNSFQRTDDLLLIAGIDRHLLEKVQPYITVKQKPLRIQKGKLSFRSIIGSTLPEDTSYAASPFGLSNRLHYSMGSMFMGATTFKDPYEGSYADFYTFYAGMKNGSTTLIAGDYAFDLGERLITGYPGLVFKSTGMVKGREAGAKPYRSGFEDFSFRGGVIEKRWSAVETALLISQSELDATIQNDTARRVIYETGYHRTPAELDKKNRIKERAAGGTVAIGNDHLRIRATCLGGSYDRRIEPDPAHYYRFCGDGYILSGFHVQTAGSHATLWSEYALSHATGGKALVLGIKAKPEKTSIVMLYRDYGETYYAPRAFALCETEVRNERGLYSFISAKLPLQIRGAGYIDIFTRPFPTYHTVFPTKGFEVFTSLEKRVMGATLYFRHKYKEKNNYQWLGENLKSIRQGIRFSAKVPVDKKSTFTVVLQGGFFAVPEIPLNEKGYLVTISFKSRFLSNVSSETGIVLFNTDSYDSRLYLFINDIPGIFNSRAFYVRGFAGYLLAKAKLRGSFLIYGKFEIETKEVTERRYRLGIEWK